MLNVSIAMLERFVDKFGDGTSICTYMEGPRRQPKGFTKNQVLATALDPRTCNLYGVSADQHERVWLLVEAALVNLLEEEDRVKRSAHAKAAGSTSAAGSSAAGVSGVRPDGADGSAGRPAGSSTAASAPQRAKRARTGGVYQQSARVPGAVAVGGASVQSTAEKAALRARLTALAAHEIAQLRAMLPADEQNDLEPVDEPASFLPILAMYEGEKLSNPLHWWRDHMVQFPRLSKLARRVLCVPATSAPSERLFSAAGLTATKHRNRLVGEAVTLLVWLKNTWDTVDDWCKKQKQRAAA